MNARWAERFAFAVVRLGLTPEAFWALSLPEWRALTAAFAPPAPMGRGDLDALLATHGELARAGDR